MYGTAELVALLKMPQIGQNISSDQYEVSLMNSAEAPLCRGISCDKNG
jgi:hypothetical protein